MTILDRSSGSFNTTTSVTVTRSTGSYGSGTLIAILVVGNTTFSNPGTSTLRTSSVVNQGIYGWDLAGTGQASIALSAGSAGSGQWFAWEMSSGSSYDTSNSAQVNTGPGSYAASITPTVGDRHILAAIGALGGSGNVNAVTAFNNSFSMFGAAQTTAQDYPFSAGADLDVTANGVSATSTTATFSSAVPIAAGGVIAAYVRAAGATSPVARQLVLAQAVNRSYTY